MSPNELIPLSFQDGAYRVSEAFKELNHFVIATHVNPDGDAIGSMAAVGYILRALGKEFLLYADPGLPHALSFLHMPATVTTSLRRTPFSLRNAILLDCNEPHRLGQDAAAHITRLVGINIDHHPGAGMGTRINWIFPEAAATAQLVAYVAVSLGIPLADPLAEAVALGIITDTGGFRHNNTTADILRLVAHLMQNGCNIFRLQELLDNNWTLGRMRLWAALMSRTHLERNGTVAFCRVLTDDLRQHQCGKEDMEGFVESLRRLRGVSVAVLLREDSPQTCKFSLRSSGNTKVLDMAASLGGGGHVNAAGGTLHLPLDRAESQLLAAVCKQLDEEEKTSSLHPRDV